MILVIFLNFRVLSEKGTNFQLIIITYDLYLQLVTSNLKACITLRAIPKLRKDKLYLLHVDFCISSSSIFLK